MGVGLVKSSCVDYLNRSKVRLDTCQDTTTLLLYKSQLFLLCFSTPFVRLLLALSRDEPTHEYPVFFFGDVLPSSDFLPLTSLVDPLICYGLRTDYRTRLFEGSKRLLEVADVIEEIKTVCVNCDRKAIINAKFCIKENGNKVILRNGPSDLDLGAEEKYQHMVGTASPLKYCCSNIKRIISSNYSLKNLLFLNQQLINGN